MCQKCVDAVKEIFPEVPESEYGDFLMGTTAFPWGNPSDVRQKLIDNRAKMIGTDYNECYGIADTEMLEDLCKLNEEDAATEVHEHEVSRMADEGCPNE